MAYVSKETKSRIADKLKTVLPKTWKWSLSVQNHSTLTLTVWGADRPLTHDGSSFELNPYHLVSSARRSWPSIDDGTLAILEAANDALHDGNHDHSDIQTDYFDVGWWVSFRLGRYDRPFRALPGVRL